MKRCVLFLIAGISTALGNGGGYVRNGVESTGGIVGFEPENTEKIAMVDEKLTVTLGTEGADVEIVYLMKNVTDEKVKVRFGFPVEETRRDDGGGIYFLGEAAEKERREKEMIRPTYCTDYSLTDGGEMVESKWQDEPAKEDGGFVGVSGWLVSEMRFAAGEEKVVRISFASAYSQAFSWVSDDGNADSASFKYRLSTAACWNGPIKSGRIVFKSKGIHPDEVRVIKPVNRFKKMGDDWVWDFENLEPTMDDDIEVEAIPEISDTTGYIDGSKPLKGDDDRKISHVSKRGDKWFATHANYMVKASSTLASDGELKYGVENLKTWWDDACWAEGIKGNGVGEWLEFSVEVPRPLHSMMIYSGYYKQDDDTRLFKANARPKAMTVSLNGEYEFKAMLDDRMEGQMIPVTAYAKPVKTVRLTFDEIYPGSQYEDMCVSAVLFNVKLEKEPELRGSR